MKLKIKILLFLPIISLLNTSCGTNFSTIFLESRKDEDKSKFLDFNSKQINNFQLVESSYYSHTFDETKIIDSKENVHQLKHENNTNIFVFEYSYFVKISKFAGINFLEDFENKLSFTLTDNANKYFNLSILDIYPTSNKKDFINIYVSNQKETNVETLGIIKEDGYYLPSSSSPIYPINRCEFDYGITDLNVARNLSKNEITIDIKFDKNISYALIKIGAILGVFPKQNVDFTLTKKDLILKNKIQFLAVQNGKYNTYISTTI